MDNLAMKTCAKCDGKVLAKGLCRKHYRAQPERALVGREGHKRWLEENAAYHKEQQAEYRKNYWAARREESKAKSAAWRKANPGRHDALKEAWRKANPEHSRAAVRRRRARIRGSEGNHTAADVLRLFEAQRRMCAICACSIEHKYEVDHIMPLALGGSNGVENIQLLCPNCNRHKSAKHPSKFQQERSAQK